MCEENHENFLVKIAFLRDDIWTWDLSNTANRSIAAFYICDVEGRLCVVSFVVGSAVQLLVPLDHSESPSLRFIQTLSSTHLVT